MVDQAEIHKMSRSKDVGKRKKAAEQLSENFSVLPDNKQAWDDLIHLTFFNDSILHRIISAIFPISLNNSSFNNRYVSTCAADALGIAFLCVLDKKQAWDDLHRLTSANYWYVRRGAAYVLGMGFEHIPDKKQAYDDLIRLSTDNDIAVRRGVASVFGMAFEHMPDKKRAWEDLVRLTSYPVSHVHRRVADVIWSVFDPVPHKKQGMQCNKRFTYYNDTLMCWHAACALGGAFPHVPDKKQAYNDLISLTSDTNNDVRDFVVGSLGSAFSQVSDKKQAWEDLCRLTSDIDFFMRCRAADALGNAFVHVPDKKQAWEDLHRLTSDTEGTMRASVYHSLGKASIFKAATAENDDELKKEMEAAIGYFEKSSQRVSLSNPANFCIPFYRSFHAIIFNKENAEYEVEKYIAVAKSVVAYSKSKEKLLEVVENLGNALKEAQKVRDGNDMKNALNSSRRYLERACELLNTTEEKAPGASSLIRRGLPIIDERIKGIIAEIQEKANVACQQSKGTPTEEIACAANRVIQKWRIDNQEEMTWAVENIIFMLSSKIPHVPENKYIHDKVENIRNERDLIKQYIMIANVVALIPSVHVEINNSTIGQVGNGQVIMNLEKNPK